MSATLLSVLDGIATLTMNRPDLHNAFDDAFVAELTQRFRDMGENAEISAILLTSNGPSFSAGADLNWMRRMAGYDQPQNIADAKNLATLLEVMDKTPKPVIGLVQGPAFGGGVGLLSCCDIVIAAKKASFCLSEVKLGLIPAVISPYVIRAIGHRASRRYFLTAERFDAQTALRLGLVHEIAEGDDLLKAAEDILAAIRQGGPKAQAAAKDLVHRVYDMPSGEAVMDWTAERIAEIRASDEGREGLTAFLEKRKPRWIGEK